MNCECAETNRILFNHANNNIDFAELIIDHMHEFWDQSECLEGNDFKGFDNEENNEMYQLFIKWFYSPNCNCNTYIKYFWKHCEMLFEDHHMAMMHASPGT